MRDVDGIPRQDWYRKLEMVAKEAAVGSDKKKDFCKF